MRILVLFPGALGDFCLLAPALVALGARGARIELSVQRSLAPLVAVLLPGVALGPPLDGAAMAGLFADEIPASLLAWLRSADHVYAWLGSSGGRVRTDLGALGVAVHLHAVPRGDGERHVGEEYAAALGLAGAQLPVRAPTLALPWGRPGSDRLVVHPGAGARAKRWSRSGFRRVADAWVDAGGEAVVLLGPAEADDAEEWRAAGYEPATDLSLPEAVGLIGSAPRWVGNDAGMSHLAGALGRCGAVLFGPTSPRRWRPLGGELATVVFAGRSDDAVAREVLAVLRLPITSP